MPTLHSFAILSLLVVASTQFLPHLDTKCSFLYLADKITEVK